MRRCLALLAVAVLSGCAALDRIDTEVSSFSLWPPGRAPQSYAFERLPSQQADPQQAQLLEDAARLAIERAGFAPTTEGHAADVTIQLGARITATDRSPFDDPFWYGPVGVWHRPFIYGRYGRPFYGPGWRAGYWRPYDDFPYYEREVALLIRDRQSGAPLYEARAESEGTSATAPNVLPAMFMAALRDFPTGSTVNPHPVVVQGTP